MKITIIHGQSHRGSTYHIAKMLAEKLKGEIAEFFLPREFSSLCIGCTNCFAKSETLCPHYEKLKPITEAIDNADVIILASPVYVYHVTGAMKVFLDHYGYRWLVHLRPEESMFSKQAVCISTAAGGGMKSTIRIWQTVPSIGVLQKPMRSGVGVREVSWNRVNDKIKNKIEKKTTSLAKRIRKNYGSVKPSIKTKAFFSVMRLVQKNGWNETDSNYWHERMDKDARGKSKRLSVKEE